jgi:hypothetical protein
MKNRTLRIGIDPPMATLTRTAQGVLWVCTDCLFAREGEAPENPHCEPWDIEGETDVTVGLMCEAPDHFDTDPDGHTEGCETVDFSTSSCDACGCHLAGTRHAYTWWA